MICMLTQYCSSDKVEKNKMGGACSAYGGEYTRFRWGNMRERDNLRDPGVDGDNIKMDFSGSWM